MPAVIDARYISGNLSGIGRYTLNLLRGIAEMGPPFPVAALTADPAALRGLAGDELRGIELIPTAGSPWSLADQWTLPRVLERMGAMLVHSPDAFSPVWARCPRVVTVHDLIPLAVRPGRDLGLKGRLRPLWRLWLRRQVRGATVLTVSNHSADDIRRMLGVTATVVYPGVTAPPPSPPADELRRRLLARWGIDGQYVLYVGRRDPYKGVPGLVEAFADLAWGGRLVVAGHRDGRFPQAEQVAQRRGIAARVTFTGQVTDAELRELYAGAAVLALPSTYEGFGLTALEAMHHGVPVVAAGRTSLPEVLGESAVYYEPGTTAALGEALGRALTDDALRARLRAGGPERAGLYTTSRQAAETLAVYDRLLSGSA